MKIGILGSGEVGKALGHGFAELGHEVKIGTRSSEKLSEWMAAHKGKGSSGTFEETAQFGDIIVLATHWEGGATENVIKMAGKNNFGGKIVIDVTNPLDFSKGMPPTLEIGTTNSAGETVQRWLPDSKVVKAWNSIGNVFMYKPQFQEGTPDGYFCGNNEGAKKTVGEILKNFGLNPVDMGGIEMARYLEPLAMVWIMFGVKTNTWNHAFKLLRK